MRRPGRGEDIRYCPNPDTLLYDWSKFIGVVRKLTQIILIPCIYLNVSTVRFESFFSMFLFFIHKSMSHVLGKCPPQFVGQVLFMSPSPPKTKQNKNTTEKQTNKKQQTTPTPKPTTPPCIFWT